LALLHDVTRSKHTIIDWFNPAVAATMACMVPILLRLQSNLPVVSEVQGEREEIQTSQNIFRGLSFPLHYLPPPGYSTRQEIYHASLFITPVYPGPDSPRHFWHLSAGLPGVPLAQSSLIQ
jgi:hypothetical protein